MQFLECVSAALDNVSVQSDVEAVLPALLKDVCISTNTLPRPVEYFLFLKIRQPSSQSLL